ncbi:MAG: hypothetical protein GC160_26030 [Acidobacteria bacterium]|nr:hypothetical protein [Acidobacteriota bacterium]
MARYLEGRPLAQGRLGVLPSAFNPPTTAHVALAEAARQAAGLDQVAFTLPERFPHKQFEGASFEQRARMLTALTAGHAGWATAATEGGLFLEMARELLQLSGPGVEAVVLCGRDAAERIVGWDYGEGPPIERQLEEFRLAVAEREGSYAPPAELASRIVRVPMPAEARAVSSSAVRAAIAAGRPWERMVPRPVAAVIRELGLYGAARDR